MPHGGARNGVEESSWGAEVTMKVRILFTTVAIAGLVLGSRQALAVSGSIQVEIPFEFVIGDRVLPPARYIVDVASGTGPSVLAIRTMASGEPVMFDTNQIPEKEDPKTLELVFDTVGDKTYLTEVWGVVDSGRAVKHLVDGHPIERAPEASRRRVSGVRIVDQKETKSGK
jgi:hypothetical protein